MKQQKRLTRSFFNRVAGEWFERTYDPRAEYRRFPSNRVRMELALREVLRLKLKGPFLDVGCGTGEIVLKLLRSDMQCVGIDNAERMIAIARSKLAREIPSADPEKVFQVSDLTEFRASPRIYRNVFALGLLEYLSDDAELFRLLGRIIPRGGRALVECRNKLFNLASLNHYTRKIAESREFPKLLNDLETVARFSRLSASAIPDVAEETTRAMSSFLRRALRDKKWRETATKDYKSYPSPMVRRQHTPQDLERSARKWGFTIQYVVYWHIHPFLPSFEARFPRIFNKLSVLMGPMGETPIGATLGSSFLAVLKRSK